MKILVQVNRPFAGDHLEVRTNLVLFAQPGDQIFSLESPGKLGIVQRISNQENMTQKEFSSNFKVRQVQLGKLPRRIQSYFGFRPIYSVHKSIWQKVI